MYRQSGKNLLSSNTFSTCPDNMANFFPLAAEIGLPVWGTPANFYGFRVLAALLHGTLIVASAKLCGAEQRAPPIFGRAAITLGIGPHSSIICISLLHYLAIHRSRTQGCSNKISCQFVTSGLSVSETGDP